jgi:hypothetical protein
MKQPSIRRYGAQIIAAQSAARHISAAAAVILLACLSSGCNQVLGLDPTHEISPNAYVCTCQCSNIGAPFVGVSEAVCLPDNLNPNKNTITLTQVDLDHDCEGRVNENVAGIVQQCVSKILNCGCIAAPIASMLTAAECDVGCTPEDLDPSCSNFDTHVNPAVKTATNIPGQPPVCLIASSDPPNPVPDPLVAGLFGHNSKCDVSGDVTVMRGGDTETQPASGVVNLTGSPCPGGSCKVGMSYRIDHVNNFSFDSFAGFESVEFQHLFASGNSIPEGATLDSAGNGTFAVSSTQNYGTGRRSNQIAGIEVSSDESAFTGTNSQPLDVGVDWINHKCHLSGALFGQLEDADTLVTADVSGDIENEPPAANAGPAQTVECTSAAGAGISLDGSASSDPENNIALYVWRQGSRSGEEIGNNPVLHVSQGIGGNQTYFLRVVDTFGQSSEDSTSVKVVDSTPPAISNVTASPNVLWPPNQKLVGVTLSVSDSDQCDPNPVCKIAQITSNEPIAPSDAQITGTLTAQLSAARLGSGSGRIYTLAVQCTDAAGDVSTANTTVLVPHDKAG